MADSLVDIEALALRCRADRAREYVQESIMCYRAGAYRSTIVNTWIAVVFDLIDKVRELALAGDAAAVAINAQYETYLAQIEAGNDQGIKNALEFERVIVATCRDKFQFFNHQQLRDLDRLREDRHQCAHPSFQRAGEPYRPSAEQARLHLRNAVEYVLSQPPIQGRSAITALETEIASEYFPKDRGRATIVLRNTALLNANDALIRGVIDSLVFGYATPTHVLFGKIQVGVALNVLLDLHRAPVEERIKSQLSKLIRNVGDADLPLVAQLVAAVNEASTLVNEAARVRLAEFLRTAPFVEIEKTMGALTRHPELATAAATRIATLDVTELAAMVAGGAQLDEVKQRALTLLGEAASYDRVNSVFLRLITPMMSSLTRADVERIIRMPNETKADLIGARGYDKFILKVREENLFPAEELNLLLQENDADYLVPVPVPEPEPENQDI
jgi:hypothetical protein